MNIKTISPLTTLHDGMPSLQEKGLKKKRRAFWAGLLALTVSLLTALSTAPAQILYSQNFDTLNNGTLVGQDGWSLYSGNSSSATIVEDASVAVSSPKFLNIAGDTGNTTRVYRQFSLNTLTDSNNNHLSFYFSPSNPQSGAKNALYLTVYGNTGAGEDKILEASIDYTDSKVYLSTGGGSYNTTVSLSSSLAAEDWYLFDAVFKPSTSTIDLTITNDSNNIIGSGTYSFAGNSGNVSEVYRMDFFNNTNGRLDWHIDNLSIIPEPATLGFLGLGIVLAIGITKRNRE